MRSKLTFSLIKVYVGVIFLIIVGIYQFVHGQTELAMTSFSSALALLGIGNQTAATRATVDPKVAVKPASLPNPTGSVPVAQFAAPQGPYYPR